MSIFVEKKSLFTRMSFTLRYHFNRSCQKDEEKKGVLVVGLLKEISDQSFISLNRGYRCLFTQWMWQSFTIFSETRAIKA